MGKNTTNDMTQGNCMRLLVQFFLPILAGNLFQQLYSFADSMVVGKGIGDTALAAVGNTGSVHFSDHWFRNWADRRIGNLYFSVFWKWQL